LTVEATALPATAAQQDDTQPAATEAATAATAAAAAASPDATAATITGAVAGGSDSNSSSSSGTKLPCAFVKLLLGLPVSVLEHGSWKRSPAAAALFKQLLPCDTDLGEYRAKVSRVLRCGSTRGTALQVPESIQLHSPNINVSIAVQEVLCIVVAMHAPTMRAGQVLSVGKRTQLVLGRTEPSI
jgi:hypothetical protein